MDLSVYLTGMSVGLSLIVAIGAQNAFVLRQGLRGEHVLWVVLACALSDAVLIGFGVTGFGSVLGVAPWLDPVMRYGGAAFLGWYGLRSLRAAFGPDAALNVTDAEEPRPLRGVLMACLAITWLNPHVYLDTLVLLGSVSTQFPGRSGSFAAGAISGSFLFFFALGYGARWLRPVFARPFAWRVLEALIAAVMWSIALRLVLGL